MDNRNRIVQKKAVPDDIRIRHKIRQKKKRRAKFVFRTTLLLLVLACSCAALMFLTPWFNIAQIEVTGNEAVDSGTIAMASGILEGENTFKINTDLAQKHVALLPYIKTVHVKRSLPSKIIIEVTESHMTASLQSTGCYVGMDEEGKALEISDAPIAGYPCITGLNVSEFSPGKPIRFDSESVKNSVLYYIDELEKNNILTDMTEINFSNMLDVKMVYKGKLTVFFGSGENLGRKILTLVEVVKHQLSEGDSGELDLRIDGKAYLRP